MTKVVIIRAEQDEEDDDGDEDQYTVWDDGDLWDEDETELTLSDAVSAVEERQDAYREAGYEVKLDVPTEVKQFLPKIKARLLR